MYFEKTATFAPIPNPLLRRKDISPIEKLVFARLTQYCGHYGVCCWPLLSELADEVCMDVGTAQMCLQRLQQLGLLKRHSISCLKKLQQHGIVKREPPSNKNRLLNAEYIYELTFIDWLIATKNGEA